MPCMFCGAISRETKKTYIRQTHRIEIEHTCDNGHEFLTVEVYPSQLADNREMSCAVRNIDRRWKRYARDDRIATDARSLKLIAQEEGITHTRVRQIRASFADPSDWLSYSKIALRNLERKNKK